MKYSKRNLYQIQKADTYKKQVLVIPIHAMHFFGVFGLCTCFHVSLQSGNSSGVVWGMSVSH